MKSDNRDKALLKALEEAALQWSASLRRVGEILNKMVAAGTEDGVILLRREKILYDKYKMSLATSRVAMRWASGDYGDDQSANELIGKIPHSRLAKMTAEVIAECVSQPHRIRSREEGRVISKTFTEMSPREVSDNIGLQGFIPINEQAQEEPRFRHCRASRLEMDDKQIVFVSAGRETIRMTVSRQLLKTATEAVGSTRRSKRRKAVA